MRLYLEKQHLRDFFDVIFSFFFEFMEASLDIVMLFSIIVTHSFHLNIYFYVQNFQDVTNDIKCEVQFDPDEVGFFK